jgi:hypothetical protein
LTVEKPKNNMVGVLIGKISLDLKNNFYNVIQPGVYKNHIEIVIKNITTGTQYTAYSKNGGYYSFYNLKSGSYVMVYYKMERNEGVHGGTAWIKGPINISIIISSTEITIVPSLNFVIKNDIGMATYSTTLEKNENNKDELLNYFREQDKNGLWAGFDVKK